MVPNDLLENKFLSRILYEILGQNCCIVVLEFCKIWGYSLGFRVHWDPSLSVCVFGPSAAPFISPMFFFLGGLLFFCFPVWHFCAIHLTSPFFCLLFSLCFLLFHFRLSPAQSPALFIAQLLPYKTSWTAVIACPASVVFSSTSLWKLGNHPVKVYFKKLLSIARKPGLLSGFFQLSNEEIRLYRGEKVLYM